ncbi:MAG: diguanylate cyclase [Actinobacteria bacterium]|nr:diguanylate cyclase [Actinomycetota bacterium]
MSLQRRLTLFFVLIVILPLAVAAFVIQRVVVTEISRRAVESLEPSLDAAVALYNDRAQALDERVRGALQFPQFGRLLRKGDADELSAFLDQRIDEASNVDFLIALDAGGRETGSVVRPGSFEDFFEQPTAQEINASQVGVGTGFTRTAPIPVRIAGRGNVGSVIGGFWLDRDLLLGSSQDGVVFSVISDGEVIASTVPLERPTPVEIDLDGPFTIDIDGEAQGRARALENGMSIVASTPSAPLAALSGRVITSMIGLLILAILGTSLLAYLLARIITQPLEELSEGALEIAEGRYDRRVKVRSRDEVGKLALAFNDMSDRLGETITELSTSRDKLQRAVQRIGETLRSTHDMNQILESILNTAVDAVGADSGVLWRFTSTRSDLYASAVFNYPDDTFGRLAVGEGVVGLAAERGVVVTLPDPDGGLSGSASEPNAPVVLATPLFSQDRVIGVLAIYREDAERPFEKEDGQTVVFLAEQGAVAIENVLLHEEAHRLSVMDSLTGIWNRRFFQMQFRQVLATATRFERTFSVLMLDIDHFKDVNDAYGHQRGDAILVEFAQRVGQTLREVDTFARYGGEEFICLLSETDMNGAATTADKILEAIRAHPFGAIGEVPVDLTVSIGVAAYPEHGDKYGALVDAADGALYRAKQAGRNCVVLAEEPEQPSGLKLAT